jgi:hypothetical protein
VITGVGLTAGAALGVAGPAFGASQDYFVGSIADTNAAPPGDCTSSTNTDCTLRQAIALANANSGQYDYIYFRSGLTGTITLTAASGGEIQVTDATYIYGPGPGQITVHAAPNTRIFNVNPANAGDVVEIDGMTLTGGNVTGEGGAVFNDDAQLRMAFATISGNTASSKGGGVYEVGNYDGGADDRFRYLTFTDNHAISGGGIAADIDWGTIRESTFTGNGATTGTGGAVYGKTGYMFDTTIAGNSAALAGGGLSGVNNINLYGTILANNTAPANPDLDAGGGYAGFDLVRDPGTSGIGTVPSVITGQDPQLGPLQNNGGLMATLKPAAGSPVVDQSYSFFYYDERSGNRVVDNPNKPNVADGNGADIGAVELTLAEGPQAVPPPPPPTVTPHKKKCKKKKHKRSAVSAKKKCKKKKKRSAPGRFRFAMPSQAGPGWPDAAGFRLDR